MTGQLVPGAALPVGAGSRLEEKGTVHLNKKMLLLYLELDSLRDGCTLCTVMCVLVKPEDLVFLVFHNVTLSL